MSTSEIATAIQSSVAESYDNLFSGVFVTAIGLFVLLAGACIAAGMLARWFGCDPGDKRALARLVAGGAVLGLCAVGAPRVDAFGGVVPFAAICAVGIATVAALIKAPRLGAGLFVVFLCAYFTPVCVRYAFAATQDFNTIALYEPVAQLAVFSSSNYLIFRVVIIAVWIVLASAAAIWLATDRDSLLPARQRSTWFRGRHADAGQGMKGAVIHGVGRGVRKGALGALSALCVMALIAVPAAISGVVASALTAGTGEISDRYVSVLDEYLIDPSVAADGEWVDGFLKASAELYAADARFLDVNTRMLYGVNLFVYVLYSDASFDQMVAIEDIDDCVGRRIDAAEPVARFNATIVAQADAMKDSLAFVSEQRDSLDVVLDALCNGPYLVLGRRGTVFVGAASAVLGILLLAVGLLARLALGRRIAKDDAAGRVLRGTHAAVCVDASDEAFTVSQVVKALADSFRQLRRRLSPGAVAVALVVAAVLVTLEVAPTLRDVHEMSEGATYVEDAVQAVASGPLEVSELLDSASGARGSADAGEAIGRALDAVERQMAAIRTLHEWGAVPEGAEDFNAAFEGSYAEEAQALESFRASLTVGELPDDAAISAYRSMHGDRAGDVHSELRALVVDYSVSSATTLASV